MAPGIWKRYQKVGELEAQARATLQAFAQRYLSTPVSVQVHVAVGNPAEQVLRVAREAGADRIAMGMHGRTAWRHTMLGSMAEAALRQAPCPMFMVRIGRGRALPVHAFVAPSRQRDHTMSHQPHPPQRPLTFYRGGARPSQVPEVSPTIVASGTASHGSCWDWQGRLWRPT
jgi:Universal stress protein family